MQNWLKMLSLDWSRWDLHKNILGRKFYFRSKIFIVTELFLNFSKNILFRFKICKKCNADADTQNWSCTGTATLRVIPHQPELITEKISRRIQHMFNHKENDWGFSHFLSWDDATDPAKGYCTPEISLTLEATVIWWVITPRFLSPRCRDLKFQLLQP